MWDRGDSPWHVYFGGAWLPLLLPCLPGRYRFPVSISFVHVRLVPRPTSSLVKTSHSHLHMMEQQTNWAEFTFIYTGEGYFAACWFFASRPFMEPFWPLSTLPSPTNLSSTHQTHACAAQQGLCSAPSHPQLPLQPTSSLSSSRGHCPDHSHHWCLFLCHGSQSRSRCPSHAPSPTLMTVG